MQFANPNAEIFVPDNMPIEIALKRTSHLGIGAHQDDLEIMAYAGILECFERDDKFFTGVTVTDGGGSPRSGAFADYSDEEMKAIRKEEQKNAAISGRYSAMAMLGYSSDEVKNSSTSASVISDLKSIIEAASPEIIYTHNLADKHETHVAVALRVIQALREVPPNKRPRNVYGCEVWRGLDWLNDEDKVAFDVNGNDELATGLLRIFESQIAGGKRYDLAELGRRRANATYYASHSTDRSQSMIFAMDLTPLMENADLDAAEYVNGFISRFAEDVVRRINKLR